MSKRNTSDLPQRWVVFDTETTGTSARSDRVVAIAALAIKQGEIVPEDSFECVVRIPYNSSAVVVHGITKEQTERDGIEESEALRLFADYVQDACLVGHHVAFDVIVLNHGNQRNGLPLLKNGAVDLMHLVMALESVQAIPPRPDPTDYSLDGLLDHFGVRKKGRHTAMGDSFLTAMLFLQLLRLSEKYCPDVLLKSIDWNIGMGSNH